MDNTVILMTMVCLWADVAQISSYWLGFNEIEIKLCSLNWYETEINRWRECICSPERLSGICMSENCCCLGCLGIMESLFVICYINFLVIFNYTGRNESYSRCGQAKIDITLAPDGNSGHGNVGDDGSSSEFDDE